MAYSGSVQVQAPLDEVFSWHERPGAFQRLLPPWQPLRIAAESESLRDGRAVLRLPGGLRWVAQHHGYDPPREFVDELTSLPLRWRHTHRFEAGSPTSTVITDQVDTPVPGRLLRATFAYRHQQVADDLAVHAAMRRFAAEPMTVAVTGSSGMVGTALCALLSTGGHSVVRLVRGPARGQGERRWDPAAPSPDLLDGVDAVVHLAGASIAGRFTANHKRLVRDSRIEPTRRLAELLARGGASRPRTLVCASAVGYYGSDRGDEILTEESARGDGFLADVVADWEEATAPAVDAGIRVVRCRTGLVLSPRGGVLALLRRLFATGLGGRLGDGRQWMSWIDLDDVTDVYYRALADDSLSGAVNVVAPNPVRNSEFTRTLAQVLRRPALVPVPPVGPRLLLGREGSREVALASQRVRPQVLESVGHPFRRPELAACLRHQLGRSTGQMPRSG